MSRLRRGVVLAHGIMTVPSRSTWGRASRLPSRTGGKIQQLVATRQAGMGHDQADGQPAAAWTQLVPGSSLDPGQTNFDDGLKRTIEWWRRQKDDWTMNAVAHSKRPSLRGSASHGFAFWKGGSRCTRYSGHGRGDGDESSCRLHLRHDVNPSCSWAPSPSSPISSRDLQRQSPGVGEEDHRPHEGHRRQTLMATLRMDAVMDVRPGRRRRDRDCCLAMGSTYKGSSAALSERLRTGLFNEQAFHHGYRRDGLHIR